MGYIYIDAKFKKKKKIIIINKHNCGRWMDGWMNECWMDDKKEKKRKKEKLTKYKIQKKKLIAFTTTQNKTKNERKHNFFFVDFDDKFFSLFLCFSL